MRQTLDQGYRAAFLYSVDPMLLLDRSGRLADANLAACKLLGWKHPPISEFLTVSPVAGETDDLEEGEIPMEIQVHGDVRGRSTDHRCVTKTRRRLSMSRSLPTGQRLLTLSADDCGSRKDNEELRRSNEALELSNLELQQFAYIASHDLQTPLRAVAGFAQFLREDYGKQLDTQAAEYIEQIVVGAETMRGLVDNLLNYSRIDSRSKPFEWTDLNVRVQEVLSTLAPAIEATGGVVECRDLPHVWAEPFQMFELFRNLIGNGIKYHADVPPRVTIGAELGRDGEHWIFSVRDNGIGIDPRYHERVFEIFRRLHRGDAYPGDGVGLAIARRIVHRHHGRIWLESQLREGSDFRFTLPCHEH